MLLVCVDLLINAIKYDESFHKPCNKRRYTEYEITYSLKKDLCNLIRGSINPPQFLRNE